MLHALNLSCALQVSFPGAYRSVCVELKVNHLAVNAVLEVSIEGHTRGGTVS